MYIVKCFWAKSSGLFHWVSDVDPMRFRSELKANRAFDALRAEGWDRVVLYKSVKGSAPFEIRRGGHLS